MPVNLEKVMSEQDKSESDNGKKTKLDGLKITAASKGRPAAEGRDPRPGWRRGMRVAFRRFLYVAGFILIFNLVSYFQLAPAMFIVEAGLVIAVILFFLALPCSAVLRVDRWVEAWSVPEGQELAIFISLFAVMINFLVLGTLVGWVRGRREDEPAPVKKAVKKERKSGANTG